MIKKTPYKKVIMNNYRWDDYIRRLCKRFELSSKWWFEYQKKKFDNIIRKHQPVLVIGIQPAVELISAAHEHNIPVIDLLHGTNISVNHIKYGVSILSSTERSLLPDCFIAPDNKSREKLKKNIFLSGQKIDCRTFHSTEKHSNYSVDIKNFNKIMNYKTVATFTLQWGVHRVEKRNPHNDGELPPLLTEIIAHPCSREILFLIQPHPVLKRSKKIMNMLHRNCSSLNNVHLVVNESVEAVFECSDLHLTLWSSATRQASLMGLTTLILSSDTFLFPPIGELHEADIDIGAAELVAGFPVEKIVERILSLKRSKKLGERARNVFLNSSESSRQIVMDLVY